MIDDELFSDLQKYTSFTKIKTNIVQIPDDQCFINYVSKLCDYYFKTNIFEKILIHVNEEYYNMEIVHSYLKDKYADFLTKNDNVIILSKQISNDEMNYETENIIVKSVNTFYPSEHNKVFFNILLPDITSLNYVGHEKITLNYKKVEDYKTIYDRLIIYTECDNNNEYEYQILKREIEKKEPTSSKKSKTRVNKKSFDNEKTKTELHDFENMKISKLKSIIVYLNKNKNYKLKSKGYTKLNRDQLVRFFEQNYDNIYNLL